MSLSTSGPDQCVLVLKLQQAEIWKKGKQTNKQTQRKIPVVCWRAVILQLSPLWSDLSEHSFLASPRIQTPLLLLTCCDTTYFWRCGFCCYFYCLTCSGWLDKISHHGLESLESRGSAEVWFRSLRSLELHLETLPTPTLKCNDVNFSLDWLLI